MEYQVLTQEERNDIIVEQRLDLERNHFRATIEKERLDREIAELSDGEEKERLTKKAGWAAKRVADAQASLTALDPVTPKDAALTESVGRVKAKGGV